jgi:hypothetical protein
VEEHYKAIMELLILVVEVVPKVVVAVVELLKLDTYILN